MTAPNIMKFVSTYYKSRDGALKLIQGESYEERDNFRIEMIAGIALYSDGYYKDIERAIEKAQTHMDAGAPVQIVVTTELSCDEAYRVFTTLERYKE